MIESDSNTEMPEPPENALVMRIRITNDTEPIEEAEPEGRPQS